MKSISVEPRSCLSAEPWSFRFAAIEFSYWAANAAANYKTVFLSAFGFSVIEVGILNAVSSAVSIFVTPITGFLADKLRSSRRVFLLLLGLMAGISAAILLIRGTSPASLSWIAVFSVLLLVLLAPSNGLLDVTVINGCDAVDVKYGKARAIGSCGAITMFALLALFVTERTIERVFVMLILFALPCMFFLTRVRQVCDGLSSNALSVRQSPQVEKLFRNPYFLVFLVFAALNSFAQTSIFLYQPYLIQAVGGSMAFLGFVQAYRVVFELPTLFFMERLSRVFSYRNMVLISSFLWGLMAILCSMIRGFGGLLLVSTLAGLGSGLFVAGSGRFNFSMVPSELQSTAQTLLYGFQAFGGILGSFIGGYFIEALGIFSFHFFIGAVNLAVMLLYALSFFVIKQIVHRDYDSFYAEP